MNLRRKLISLITAISMLVPLTGVMPVTAATGNQIALGSYLQMGTYGTDSDGNAKPILWRCAAFEKATGDVIDSTETQTAYQEGYLPLMLADTAICNKAFDAKGDAPKGSHVRGDNRGTQGSNYWGDSNIRDWLNSDGIVNYTCGHSPTYFSEAGFLKKFSNTEKAAIKTVTQKSLLAEPDNTIAGATGDAVHTYETSISEVVQNYNTTAYSEQVADKMFLLDVQQAKNVYDNDASLGGCYNISDTYWLRTPRDNTNCYTRQVIASGAVTDALVSLGNNVRPAFFLNPAAKLSGSGTSDDPYVVTEMPLFDGDGTEESPYLIGGIEALEKLRDSVNGGNTYEGKFIKLTADVDMADAYNAGNGKSWTPIGNSSNKFKGVFDGDNHTIGLYKEELFDYIDANAVIKNLNVTGDVTEGSYCSVCAFNNGTISNCSFSGTADTADNSYAYVGGISYNNGGVIEDCMFSGSINGTLNNGIGGICGLNEGNGTIRRCCSIGTVSGKSAYGSAVYLGGICGINKGAITDCYNTGSITNTEEGFILNSYVGGIAGHGAEYSGTITNSYNIGKLSSAGGTRGGVYGYETSSEQVDTSCYYLDTCGVTNPALGTLITEDDFNSEETFTGWEFGTVWKMSSVLGRPILTAIPEPEPPHKHKACGDADCAHGHEDITWTAWESDNELPQTEGSYYLTQDVILAGGSAAIAVNVDICLNGHKITQTYNTETIEINAGTLNISDCKDSGEIVNGNIASNVQRCINLNSTAAVLNMYGGKITNFAKGVAGEGGGTFNMYGGEILNNIAANENIGARIASGGTFNMYGGKITGCKDYGVYLGRGQHIINGEISGGNYGIIVSGDTRITLRNGAKFADNVTADAGLNETEGTPKFVLDGYAPADNYKISVDIAQAPAQGSTVFAAGVDITTENEADCSGYFVSAGEAELNNMRVIDTANHVVRLAPDEMLYIERGGEKVYFGTLAAALEAVEENETIVVNADYADPTIAYFSKNNITLDLNGKHISVPEDKTVSDSCNILLIGEFFPETEISLKIKDSSAEKSGKIDGGFVVSDPEGKISLTIEGGTYGMLNVQGNPDITLNGGVYTSNEISYGSGIVYAMLKNAELSEEENEELAKNALINMLGEGKIFDKDIVVEYIPDEEVYMAKFDGGAKVIDKSAAEATAEPTAEPTSEPIAEATAEPTAEPTSEPIAEATAEPTAEPTSEPIAEATAEPTAEPTSEPIAEATAEPTAEPTSGPITEATAEPTAEPTSGPIAEATAMPTALPTAVPQATATPAVNPTAVPQATATPAVNPTAVPQATATPAVNPTAAPTKQPSGERFDIAGTVKDQDNNGVANVKLWLKQGNTVISAGEVITDENGKFEFTDVAPDIYNIVAEYTEGGNTVTVTSIVSVKDKNVSVDIILNEYSANSILEIKENTPAVIVGGLDELAADYASKSDSVTIKMTVESKQENSESEEQSAIKLISENGNIEYLDISLFKTVNDVESSINETSNTITIIIPFDSTDKTNIKVYRYHDGSAEVLGSNEADGEYYVVGDGIITVYANKFSTYAIGYDTETVTPSPSTSPEATETPSQSPEPTPTPKPKRRGGGSSSSSPTPSPSASPVPETTAAPSAEPTAEPEPDVHEAYIKGYGDMFKPDGKITRAETAAIISRLTAGFDENGSYEGTFPDVADSAWYKNYVGFAQEKGFITGYTNGVFKPEESITRAEFAVVLSKSQGIGPAGGMDFADVPPSYWAAGYIGAMGRAGYITGYTDGKFRPDSAITRAEAVAIINRALGRNDIKDYENPFTDVKESHWAYEDIMEASITHNAKN